MFAFQISEDDIANVLSSHSYRPKDGETIESICAYLMLCIDAPAVENAALYGDSLEEQTSYAYDEITEQLVRQGILVNDVPLSALG